MYCTHIFTISTHYVLKQSGVKHATQNSTPNSAAASAASQSGQAKHARTHVACLFRVRSRARTRTTNKSSRFTPKHKTSQPRERSAQITQGLGIVDTAHSTSSSGSSSSRNTTTTTTTTTAAIIMPRNYTCDRPTPHECHTTTSSSVRSLTHSLTRNSARDCGGMSTLSGIQFSCCSSPHLLPRRRDWRGDGSRRRRHHRRPAHALITIHVYIFRAMPPVQQPQTERACDFIL